MKTYYTYKHTRYGIENKIKIPFGVTTFPFFYLTINAFWMITSCIIFDLLPSSISICLFVSGIGKSILFLYLFVYILQTLRISCRYATKDNNEAKEFVTKILEEGTIPSNYIVVIESDNDWYMVYIKRNHSQN